jgi:hypothetical protein
MSHGRRSSTPDSGGASAGQQPLAQLHSRRAVRAGLGGAVAGSVPSSQQPNKNVSVPNRQQQNQNVLRDAGGGADGAGSDRPRRRTVIGLDGIERERSSVTGAPAERRWCNRAAKTVTSAARATLVRTSCHNFLHADRPMTPMPSLAKTVPTSLFPLSSTASRCSRCVSCLPLLPAIRNLALCLLFLLSAFRLHLSPCPHSALQHHRCMCHHRALCARAGLSLPPPLPRLAGCCDHIDCLRAPCAREDRRHP